MRNSRVATYFVLGISAKVRCTYVQPGQGRIPRAPGRLSHSCRIVHAQSLGVRVHRTRDDRCSCKRDVAGSPLRSSPVHVGRLRLHSACINPRDRPREAPPSAMPNAARTAAQGRDGESRVKDWTRPAKKRRGEQSGGGGGGVRNAGPREKRETFADYLQGMPRDCEWDSARQMGANDVPSDIVEKSPFASLYIAYHGYS